jgi:hypothetical protein
MVSCGCCNFAIAKVKEDSTFSGEWLPVGKGSGSYIRVQTFQHVGQGQGDYEPWTGCMAGSLRIKPQGCTVCLGF